MTSTGIFAKPIFFRCSTTIRAMFPSIPDACFVEVEGNNYLRLYVGKGGYTPTYDIGDIEFKDALQGSAIAPVMRARYGFEATFAYSDSSVRHCIRAIIKNSISADFRFLTPVEILDFVEPEWDERQFFSDQPYTRRFGRIMDIKPQALGVGTPFSTHGDGFTLIFKEFIKRIFV